MRKHNLIISVALLCVAIFLVVSCDETKAITSLDLPAWAVGKTYTGTVIVSGVADNGVEMTLTASDGKIEAAYKDTSQSILTLSDELLAGGNYTGSVSAGSDEYSIAIKGTQYGINHDAEITMTPTTATFRYTKSAAGASVSLTADNLTVSQ